MRLNKLRIVSENLLLLTHFIIITLLIIIHIQLSDISFESTVIKGKLEVLYLQNKLQLSKDNYYYSNKQYSTDNKTNKNKL